MNIRKISIIIGLVAFFAGNALAQGAVIKMFSGSGGRNTQPFVTTSPWEIQWNAQGDIFQLYLYTASGDMVGSPASQQGSEKGSSYQPKAGKYYLQVNALGK